MGGFFDLGASRTQVERDSIKVQSPREPEIYNRLDREALSSDQIHRGIYQRGGAVLKLVPERRAIKSQLMARPPRIVAYLKRKRLFSTQWINLHNSVTARTGNCSFAKVAILDRPRVASPIGVSHRFVNVTQRQVAHPLPNIFQVFRRKPASFTDKVLRTGVQ